MADLSSETRPPWYLKVIGGLLVGMGALTLVGLVAAPPQDRTGNALALNVAIILLLLIGGVGLVIGVRWAWFVVLVTALAGFGLGVTSMTGPGDITVPGEVIVSLFILVIPSALMAIALFTPRSISWLRDR